MIVATVHGASLSQLEQVARYLTPAVRRRQPLVVPSYITITTHPDQPTWRAKRGHTPRWTRTPRIRTTRPNRNDT